MRNLFKRYRLGHPAQGRVRPFTFMTVCQQVKPMSLVAFEFSQQSLEFASDWLYQQQPSNSYGDAGHFVIDKGELLRFQENLTRYMTMNSIPVLLSNCHETLVSAMPALLPDETEETLGFVSIGEKFALKQTLGLQLDSAFHFILSRYPQARLFTMGIDEHLVTPEAVEYAEDMACDWLSLDECSFRQRNNVKARLSSFVARNDHLVVNIDLASLVPPVHGIDDVRVIDHQVALRALNQCLASGKVKLIQLVGASDKLIYSRENKALVDRLCSLSDSKVVAA